MKKGQGAMLLLAAAACLIVVMIGAFFVLEEEAANSKELNAQAEIECIKHNGVWGDRWVSRGGAGYSCTFENEICEYHSLYEEFPERWQCTSDGTLENARRRSN